MTSISIILCCHNSTERLPKTLRHLSKQTLGHADWEVIVVDNASTDGTADIAREIWDDVGAPASLRVVNEKMPGIAYARRAGALAAVGKVLLFCDDDNWLAPDYAEVALAILASDLEIGAVGGCSKPFFEGLQEPPPWFWGSAPSFAVGAQALRSGDVSQRGYLWGAGLTLRADLFKRICASGVEPLLVGRVGRILLSGDDSEVCAWYLLAGFRLHYSDRLRFQHFMPKSRQSVEYFERMSSGHRAARDTLLAYRAFAMRRQRWVDIMHPSLRSLVALARNEAILLLLGYRVWRTVRAVRDLAGGRGHQL